MTTRAWTEEDVRALHEHTMGVFTDEEAPVVLDLLAGLRERITTIARGTAGAGAYGVLSWDEAAATITGNARVDNGRFAIADPRQAPPVPPVIRSAWDCWHRPMTTLELALLQGLPLELGGAPLSLAGRSIGRWRERIGNAVPVGAATAIAESILLALLAGKLGTWTLGSTGIWVDRNGRSEHEWRTEP